MTEEQIIKHKKWCRCKYGTDGEDIFHQAWIYAQGYGGIEKINQSLFGLLCRWAARELKKHEMHEIPFSCLVAQNEDREEFAEFEPEDPTWKKNFDAVENREEIQKIHGNWLMNALLKTTAEKTKPSKVTTEQIDIQMELFA